MRGRAVLLAALLAGCTPSSPATHEERQQPQPQAELKLLTGLPILFAEKFSLDAPAHPLVGALERHFRLVPIAATDASQLGRGGLLLMAQPRAQTAENLVVLDEWVRGGGRLLLVADPRLEWHSDKPLGDPTRPPLAYEDSGLLAHWGLALDPLARAGPATMTIGGQEVRGASRGTLRASGSDCRVRAGALVADCRIGRGRVTVIADADWLDLGPEGPGWQAEAHVDALVAELDALAR